MPKDKKWEEFTEEEKTSLLNHWFYYYGGTIMTLKDIENFRKISGTKQDEIFNHIVTLYIYKRTIQSNLLVACLREQKTDELFAQSLKLEDVLEGKEQAFEDIRKMITNEILSSFIAPEPPVPMDIHIIVEDDGPKRSH